MLDPLSSKILSSSDILGVMRLPSPHRAPQRQRPQKCGSAGALDQREGTAGARLASSQLFKAGGGGDAWCSPKRQLGEPGWGPHPRLPSVPPSCSPPAGGGWGCTWGPRPGSNLGGRGRGLPEKEPGKSMVAYCWVLNSFHPPFFHPGLRESSEEGKIGSPGSN